MSNASTFLKNVPLHVNSILPGLGRRRFTASQPRPLRNRAGLALLFLAGLLGVSQPALAAEGDFLNISTRAYVGTGDEVMIGGFIIRDGSQRVVIHALGPELTSRGVSNALADPVLRIINTSDPANVRELMRNDNWEDTQGQLISDLWGTALPFTAGSQGSAAVLTLQPGNYTAIVEGKNGTSGIALVEVWRRDSFGTDGNFVNISTRGVVRTGDEVMIGGFIIRGAPRQVAIHALGPELTNRGVSNVLADPVLRVIDTTDPGNPVELMVNDDWEDSQGQLLADLWGPGLSFTAGSKSSAAVLTLEPGNYTAIVEGKNGTSGIALVEVLSLDSSGADGSGVRRLTNNSADDWHPAWSPDGARIAFVSDRDGNDEIYVMNADGSGVRRLTNNSANDRYWYPAWSPDGARIAFTSSRDGNEDIYVMNADGSGVRRLTNNFADDWVPAWSPDGTRIAFGSERDGNDEIYVMNADGSGVRRLTNNFADDWYYSWSPDGTRIAFGSDRDGNDEIYVMNADGSGVRRLTNNSANDLLPAWSPDGARIAFVSDRDGNEEIYVMNADGSGVRRLTNNFVGDWVPLWSPDGTRIAFGSERTYIEHKIYVMNADGTGVRRLTNYLIDEDDSLHWSPDGARIAFRSASNGNPEIYVVDVPQ